MGLQYSERYAEMLHLSKNSMAGMGSKYLTSEPASWCLKLTNLEYTFQFKSYLRILPNGETPNVDILTVVLPEVADMHVRGLNRWR